MDNIWYYLTILGFTMTYLTERTKDKLTATAEKLANRTPKTP